MRRLSQSTTPQLTPKLRVKGGGYSERVRAEARGGCGGLTGGDATLRRCALASLVHFPCLTGDDGAATRARIVGAKSASRYKQLVG